MEENIEENICTKLCYLAKKCMDENDLILLQNYYDLYMEEYEKVQTILKNEMKNIHRTKLIDKMLK